MLSAYLEPETVIESATIPTDGSQMQANLLVREPTKPTKRKQLPLVTAHSNVLDGPINHLCFTYTYSN